MYFPGKILVNYAHLPQQCITGILLSLVSSNSSNAAIRELYENKQINNKELYFSVIISSFFSSISHFPTIFIPLISILGWPGALFISIRILVSFLYMLTAILISRKVNPKIDISTPNEMKQFKINLDLKKIFEVSLTRSKKLLKKITLIVMPMYILIAIHNYYKIFNQINFLLPAAIKNILPSSSYLIIAAQFNHLLSGASIAAVMMQNQELSGKMVLITLLIGSVLSTPIRTIRHSLPGYIGILSPKKGIKLLLINQLSRTILTVIIIVFIFIFLRG